MMSANLPFSMLPMLLLPVVVQHLRGRQIGGLQRLRRRHAPFHVVGELIGLLAVRDGAPTWRRCRTRSARRPRARA